MDLHRLRVVGFDTLVSEELNDKEVIPKPDECKQEEFPDVTTDEKTNETNELATDKKNAGINVSSSKSTKILSLPKSKSEVLRIPSKYKLKKPESKLNSSLEDLNKSKASLKTKQKKRTLHLFNRKCTLDQKAEDTKKPKHGSKENEEINFLFKRESHSFKRQWKKRCNIEKPRKCSDYKHPDDIFGFKKRYRVIDPYLYHMSCNYLNTDKLKKMRFRQRVKPSQHSQPMYCICKHHAMRVLTSAIENSKERGDSSIYYNVDTPGLETRSKPYRTRHRGDYSDYEEIWSRDFSFYKAKDQSASVSPSSLLPLERNYCDAYAGPSKDDITSVHHPSCLQLHRPRSRSTPSRSTSNKKTLTKSPVQSRHRAVSCKTKKNDTNEMFSRSKVIKDVMNDFIHKISELHARQCPAVGKNCIKYSFFGILILVWTPCLLLVILAWVVMCPVRMTSVLAEEKTRKSFLNSMFNRFRKKGPESEYQQMRCSHCSRQNHKTILSSMASWYTRAAGTVANTFNAIFSLLRPRHSPRARSCAASSFISPHPNPKKRYTLFYANNRGWLMKPARHSTTRSCYSSRVIQSMRCEFKPKFWQKSKPIVNRERPRIQMNMGKSCEPCILRDCENQYLQSLARDPDCECDSISAHVPPRVTTPKCCTLQKNRPERDTYAEIDTYAERDTYADRDTYVGKDKHAGRDNYAGKDKHAVRDTYAGKDKHAWRDTYADGDTKADRDIYADRDTYAGRRKETLKKKQVNIPKKQNYPTSLKVNSSKYRTVKAKPENIYRFRNRKDFVEYHPDHRIDGTLPFGLVFDCHCGAKHPIITNQQIFRTHNFGLAGKTLNMKPKYITYQSVNNSQRQFNNTKITGNKCCPCGKKKPLRWQQFKSRSCEQLNKFFKDKMKLIDKIKKNTLKDIEREIIRTRNRSIMADLSRSALTKQANTSTNKIEFMDKSQSFSKDTIRLKSSNIALNCPCKDENEKIPINQTNSRNRKVSMDFGTGSDKQIGTNDKSTQNEDLTRQSAMKGKTLMYGECSCCKKKISLLHTKEVILPGSKTGLAKQSESLAKLSKKKSSECPCIEASKLNSKEVVQPEHEIYQTKQSATMKKTSQCACKEVQVTTAEEATQSQTQTGQAQKTERTKKQTQSTTMKKASQCACKEVHVTTVEEGTQSQTQTGQAQKTERTKKQTQSATMKKASQCACKEVQVTTAEEATQSNTQTGQAQKTEQTSISSRCCPCKINTTAEQDAQTGLSNQSISKATKCACTNVSSTNRKEAGQPELSEPNTKKKIVCPCADGPNICPLATIIDDEAKTKQPAQKEHAIQIPSTSQNSEKNTTNPKKVSQTKTDKKLVECGCGSQNTTVIKPKRKAMFAKKQEQTTKPAASPKKSDQITPPNTAGMETLNPKKSTSNKKPFDCGCRKRPGQIIKCPCNTKTNHSSVVTSEIFGSLMSPLVDDPFKQIGLSQTSLLPFEKATSAQKEIQYPGQSISFKKSFDSECSVQSVLTNRGISYIRDPDTYPQYFFINKNAQQQASFCGSVVGGKTMFNTNSIENGKKISFQYPQSQQKVNSRRSSNMKTLYNNKNAYADLPQTELAILNLSQGGTFEDCPCPEHPSAIDFIEQPKNLLNEKNDSSQQQTTVSENKLSTSDLKQLKETQTELTSQTIGIASDCACGNKEQDASDKTKIKSDETSINKRTKSTKKTSANNVENTVDRGSQYYSSKQDPDVKYKKSHRETTQEMGSESSSNATSPKQSDSIKNRSIAGSIKESKSVKHKKSQHKTCKEMASESSESTIATSPIQSDSIKNRSIAGSIKESIKSLINLTKNKVANHTQSTQTSSHKFKRQHKKSRKNELKEQGPNKQTPYISQKTKHAPKTDRSIQKKPSKKEKKTTKTQTPKTDSSKSSSHKKKAKRRKEIKHQDKTSQTKEKSSKKDKKVNKRNLLKTIPSDCECNVESSISPHKKLRSDRKKHRSRKQDPVDKTECLCYTRKHQHRHSRHEHSSERFLSPCACKSRIDKSTSIIEISPECSCCKGKMNVPFCSTIEKPKSKSARRANVSPFKNPPSKITFTQLKCSCTHVPSYTMITNNLRKIVQADKPHSQSIDCYANEHQQMLMPPQTRTPSRYHPMAKDKIMDANEHPQILQKTQTAIPSEYQWYQRMPEDGTLRDEIAHYSSTLANDPQMLMPPQTTTPSGPCQIPKLSDKIALSPSQYNTTNVMNITENVVKQSNNTPVKKCSCSVDKISSQFPPNEVSCHSHKASRFLNKIQCKLFNRKVFKQQKLPEQSSILPMTGSHHNVCNCIIEKKKSSLSKSKQEDLVKNSLRTQHSLFNSSDSSKYYSAQPFYDSESSWRKSNQVDKVRRSHANFSASEKLEIPKDFVLPMCQNCTKNPHEPSFYDKHSSCCCKVDKTFPNLLYEKLIKTSLNNKKSNNKSVDTQKRRQSKTPQHSSYPPHSGHIKCRVVNNISTSLFSHSKSSLYGRSTVHKLYPKLSQRSLSSSIVMSMNAIKCFCTHGRSSQKNNNETKLRTQQYATQKYEKELFLNNTKYHHTQIDKPVNSIYSKRNLPSEPISPCHHKLTFNTPPKEKIEYDPNSALRTTTRFQNRLNLESQPGSQPKKAKPLTGKLKLINDQISFHSRTLKKNTPSIYAQTPSGKYTCLSQKIHSLSEKLSQYTTKSTLTQERSSQQSKTSQYSSLKYSSSQITQSTSVDYDFQKKKLANNNKPTFLQRHSIQQTDIIVPTSEFRQLPKSEQEKPSQTDPIPIIPGRCTCKQGSFSGQQPSPHIQTFQPSAEKQRLITGPVPHHRRGTTLEIKEPPKQRLSRQQTDSSVSGAVPRYNSDSTTTSQLPLSTQTPTPESVRHFPRESARGTVERPRLSKNLPSEQPAIAKQSRQFSSQPSPSMEKQRLESDTVSKQTEKTTLGPQDQPRLSKQIPIEQPLISQKPRQYSSQETPSAEKEELKLDPISAHISPRKTLESRNKQEQEPKFLQAHQDLQPELPQKRYSAQNSEFSNQPNQKPRFLKDSTDQPGEKPGFLQDQQSLRPGLPHHRPIQQPGYLQGQPGQQSRYSQGLPGQPEYLPSSLDQQPDYPLDQPDQQPGFPSGYSQDQPGLQFGDSQSQPGQQPRYPQGQPSHPDQQPEYPQITRDQQPEYTIGQPGEQSGFLQGQHSLQPGLPHHRPIQQPDYLQGQPGQQSRYSQGLPGQPKYLPSSLDQQPDYPVGQPGQQSGFPSGYSQGQPGLQFEDSQSQPGQQPQQQQQQQLDSQGQPSHPDQQPGYLQNTLDQQPEYPIGQPDEQSGFLQGQQSFQPGLPQLQPELPQKRDSAQNSQFSSQPNQKPRVLKDSTDQPDEKPGFLQDQQGLQPRLPHHRPIQQPGYLQGQQGQQLNLPQGQPGKFRQSPSKQQLKFAQRYPGQQPQFPQLQPGESFESGYPDQRSQPLLQGTLRHRGQQPRSSPQQLPENYKNPQYSPQITSSSSSSEENTKKLPKKKQLPKTKKEQETKKPPGTKKISDHIRKLLGILKGKHVCKCDDKKDKRKKKLEEGDMSEKSLYKLFQDVPSRIQLRYPTEPFNPIPIIPGSCQCPLRRRLPQQNISKNNLRAQYLPSKQPEILISSHSHRSRLFQPKPIIKKHCKISLGTSVPPRKRLIYSDAMSQYPQKNTTEIQTGYRQHLTKQHRKNTLQSSTPINNSAGIITGLRSSFANGTWNTDNKLSEQLYSNNKFFRLPQQITIQRSEIALESPSTLMPLFAKKKGKQAKKPNKSQTAPIDKLPPGLLQSRGSAGQLRRKGSAEARKQKLPPPVIQQKSPCPDFNRVRMRYPGNIPVPAKKATQVTKQTEHAPPANYYYQPAAGASPPNYSRYPCFINPANKCGPHTCNDELGLRRAYKRRPLITKQPNQKKNPKKNLKKKNTSKTKAKIKPKKKQGSDGFFRCLIKSVTEAEKEAWPDGVSCHPMYIHAMKRKPCFWIFRCWPSIYPAFLNFYKFQQGVCQMFMYVVSICFWCPFIVCVYVCCNVMCKGGGS